MTTSLFEISAIELGERACRDTGSLRKLADSIAYDGMAFPVTVSPRNRLITGARRLAAHKVLGRQQIRGQRIFTVAEALGVLIREQQDTRYAKPMSLTETIALDRAMRDELGWWPRQRPGQGRSTGSGGHNAEVAAVLGLNLHQYMQIRELYAAARGYREHHGERTLVSEEIQQRAQAAIARLKYRSQINPVYEAFRKGMPEEVRSASGRRIRSAGHEAAFASALSTLTGITIGLKDANPADAGVTAAQAAEWDAELTTALTTLRIFRGKLRELI